MRISSSISSYMNLAFHKVLPTNCLHFIDLKNFQSNFMRNSYFTGLVVTRLMKTLILYGCIELIKVMSYRS